MVRNFFRLLCAALVALVTLSSCEKAPEEISGPSDPLAPSGDGYQLSDNVVILSEAFVSSITESNPEQRYFVSTSTAIPEPGAILISNRTSEVFPSGFLGKVRSVYNNIVYYDPVRLEEAFKELKIDEQNLDLGNAVSRIEDMNGKPVEFVKSKAVSSASVTVEIPNLTWDLVKLEAERGGASIAGKCQVTPEMSFTLGMRFQAIIQDSELLAMNILLDPSYHIGATFSIGVEASLTASIDLMTVYFMPVSVGPLIFTPKLVISGYVTESGKVAFEGKLTTDGGYSFGAGYETGDWRDICRETDSGSGTQDITSLQMEGAVEVGLRPAFHFRLYDILGVSATMQAGIKESGTVTLENPYSSDLNIANTLAFTTSFATHGELNINAEVAGKELYSAFKMSTPEWSKELYKMYAIPEICEDSYSYVPTQTGAAIKAKVKRNIVGHPLIYARVYTNKRIDYSTGKSVTIYDDEQFFLCSYGNPTEDEPAELTCTASGLEEGRRYYIEFATDFFGRKIMLAGDYSHDFRTMNPDIYNAAVNLWRNLGSEFGFDKIEGSPWEEGNERPLTYMDLSFDSVHPGVLASINFRLPYKTIRDGGVQEEWTKKISFPSSISFPEGFSRGLESLSSKVYWYLNPMTNDAIEEIKEFHSKDPNFDVSGPEHFNNLEILDIQGSRLINNIYVSENSYAKLRNLTLINTGFESLRINNSPTLKSVTVRNDPSGVETKGSVTIEFNTETSFNLENINELLGKYVDFSKIKYNGVNLVSLGYGFGELVSGECKVVSIFESDDASFSFIGLESLEKISIDAATSLTVSDCPLLQTISCNPSESLSISKCPSWTGGALFVDGSVSVSECNGANYLRIHTDKSVSVSDCESMTELEIESYNGSITARSCPATKSLTLTLPTTDKLSVDNFPAVTSLHLSSDGLVPAIIDQVRNRQGSKVYYHERYEYFYDSNHKLTKMNDTGYGLYYPGEPGRGYHIKFDWME